MEVARSREGVPIRLTRERWAHIIRRHPEMALQRTRVLETLSDPDLIQEGDYGERLAARFYDSTPLTHKHLVVVYREATEEDGFVVTAYFARRLSAERRVIWRR